MTLRSLVLLAALVTAACATHEVAPPRHALGPPPPRSFYRFEFVLTSRDGTAAPKSTTFTIALQEGDQGELLVGRNVSLATGAIGGPRQDVGMRVRAHYFEHGDEVLLTVETEMSALDAPSEIRKIVARDDALAPSGKPTLVASLDDDAKHYQLTVTPTKLH